MSGPQRIFWGAAGPTSLMGGSSSPGFMADAQRLQGAGRSTMSQTASSFKQGGIEAVVLVREAFVMVMHQLVFSLLS